MKYQKILFATDFSPFSEAALPYATLLARGCGALLLIAHVEELPPPFATGETYLALTPPPSADVRRMLEAVVPGDPEVRYEHRHLVGNPASEIVRLADEEKVDLIVMSTHGRTGLTRVLMGSVAEAVLRNANCPVLTFRRPGPDMPQV